MGKLLEHLHSEDILCHAYIGDAENVSLNEKSVEIHKEKVETTPTQMSM